MFTQVNGGTEANNYEVQNMQGIITCGSDDYCDRFDGFCHPNYH